jgi:DNA-directed RNA polymerase subunit K
MPSEVALQLRETSLYRRERVIVVKKSEKPKTRQDFTRFEQARILGARALQISLGAPILVDAPPEVIDPLIIAEMEYESGVIPITVVHKKLTPPN